MDSLSHELSSRLYALGLCAPRDVRRCRARVRRMCRDLPAFDSVWLDALVQLGRLTPYQARVCSEQGPEALAVGSYLLEDRLAGDRRWECFVARQPGNASRVRLTRLRVAEADLDAVLLRLQRGIEDGRRRAATQLLLPQAAQRVGDQLVVVSPLEAGRSLGELLVRRGRFPLEVVLEVMRQMAAGLGSLERSQQWHGDLRLRHVQITAEGRLQISLAGVLAAMEPWVTIHADLPPDAYDGIAPELIDTRQERTLASDLYAAGCLWWTLLAGRPPFPAGDPLLKLAAHQSRAVPDVRSWAPETPAAVAELLQWLTAADPTERPCGFWDVLQQVGRPSAEASPRLRRFVRSFESAAPRSQWPADESPASPVRWLAAGTVALVLAAGGWMQWSGQTDWLSRVRAAVVARNGEVLPAATTRERPAAGGQGGADNAFQPLPEPRQGVIELTSAGPYRAQAVRSAGALTIVGREGLRPVIEVDDSALVVTASKVVLQNVVLARRSTAARAPGPLLSVTALDFGLVNCELRSDSSPVGVSSGRVLPADGAAFVDWSPLSAPGAAAGRIGWLDVALSGRGDGLRCGQCPGSVQLQNVVHAGEGRLVSLPSAGFARAVPVTLRRVSLRGTLGAVSLSAEPDRRPPAVLLTLEHCVIAPGPQGALIELRDAAAGVAVSESCRAVQVGGLESLLQAGAPLVWHRVASGGAAVAGVEAMSVEGLRSVALEFAGPPSADIACVQLTAVEGRGPIGVVGCEIDRLRPVAPRAGSASAVEAAAGSASAVEAAAVEAAAVEAAAVEAAAVEPDAEGSPVLRTGFNSP